MRTKFLAFLTLFATLFGVLASWVTNKKRKHDPFDNTGRAWSHVVKWYHQHGLKVAGGFALVAIALLPASAMPVWSASHGAIKFVTTAKLGLAGATAAAKVPPKAPFRYGTARRRINIGSFQYQPGTQLPAVVIPQVGMLARVLFDVEGSYTVANAALVVNNLDGMDAIFSRAQITLNNGSAQVVDLSGVGVNLMNQSINPSLPIKRGTAGVGNVQGNGFGLAVGAQTFSYKGFLPVNANQKRQFEMGLINLQAPELRATINLTFNPLATLFTVAANCTNFVATCNLSYEYYEIPDLTRYNLPTLTLVRTIEEAPQAINATGLQVYQIPRLGTMIDYHAAVVLNQKYTDVRTALTEFAIRYNKTDVQYDVNMGDWETYEAEIYGSGVGPAVTPSAASDNAQTMLNTSALSFNLWAAGDRPWNGGDFRDAIDTEENTTTEILLTVAAGTALNAGKDNIFHIRRVVQRIIPASAPIAA
jgi:hypothetical protein